MTHHVVVFIHQSLRLYDVAKNALRTKLEHKAPVLSCAFAPTGDAVVSGGLDTYLRQ